MKTRQKIKLKGVEWRIDIEKISNGFVVSLPIYPKCKYFGKTKEEAIKEVKEGFQEIHERLSER